jgi:hypothetical protein
VTAGNKYRARANCKDRTGHPTSTLALIEAVVCGRRFSQIAESAAPPGYDFKGRDPIPQTDSRPPGFVARYEDEFGELKMIFLVQNLGQQRQRQADKVAHSTKGRRAPKPKKKRAKRRRS